VPKTPRAPWKAAEQAERRRAAEERQKKYAALPLHEKLKRAGQRERQRLLTASGES
jgi:hypothetical protein